MFEIMISWLGASLSVLLWLLSLLILPSVEVYSLRVLVTFEKSSCTMTWLEEWWRRPLYSIEDLPYRHHLVLILPALNCCRSLVPKRSLLFRYPREVSEHQGNTQGLDGVYPIAVYWGGAIVLQQKSVPREPIGVRNCLQNLPFWYTQKYKSLFSQVRSNKFLYVGSSMKILW